MRKLKQLLTLLISAGLLLVLLPLSVWGIGTLSNPGLEAPFVPYGDYNGWDLQVANGWEKFIVKENTYNDGSRLRFFSASDWAAFNSSPVVEKVEGAEAQVWWSSSTKKFDAGVYQQVSGLTVGETYGFQTGVLQVFETSGRSDPATGMMSRRWGIDPTGGVSPTGTTVIWSPEEQHAAYSSGGQKYTWFWGSVGAEALSTTMTVFVRVSSVGGGSTPHSDQVWADDAFFDIAPTAALTVSLTNPIEALAQWSATPRSGFTAYASEAQYRPLTATTWTDLQIFDVLDASPPTDTSATFPVQAENTYIVRTRTWHEKEVNGRTHQVAGPWTLTAFNTRSSSFSNPGLESFKADGVADNWATFTTTGAVTYTGAVTWAAQTGTSPQVKEGNDAQVWTANQAFDAGIYQQVYSLTVGQAYGFAAYQAYSPTGVSLIQNVGLDPTGGTDPNGLNVVWGLTSNDPDWSLTGVGVEAISDTMTAFVRSYANGNTSTTIWADDATLRKAAGTDLTLSNAVPFQVQASWSNTPDTGYTLYAYESQYKTANNSDWTDLQILSHGPSVTPSRTFTATAGVTYTVRARTWQKMGDYAVPGPWVEKTITPQSQISGVVIDNQGLPFKGITVTVTGQSLTDNTAGDGSFNFSLLPGVYTLTAANAAGWQTRVPVSVTLPDVQPVSVTLTVIPPDDVIVNGTFEDGLNGWQSTFTHTGGLTGSGYLNAGLIITGAGSLSQTGLITNAYKPALTFWYKIEGGDGVSSLSARVFGRPTLTPTQSLVFTQSTGGWQRAILPLNLAEYEPGAGGTAGTPVLPVPNTYSGAIGVEFTVNYSGTETPPAFYLDEVVLGSSQPEPEIFAIYLPIVLKNYSPPAPPTPEPTCPTTSTRQFQTIPVVGKPIEYPDSQHGDLNLSLRGWLTVTESLNLVNYNGSHDPNAPQIARMFNPDGKPQFTSAYRVYDWNWGCGGPGCPGGLLTQWGVTLLGMGTAQGQGISIPGRGPTLYQGQYQAVVLYAEETRITLSYLREDTVAGGYAVHIEDVCVDPNLLALYRQQVKEDGYRRDGYQLPAISNNQLIGTAPGNTIKVAIRDKGTFMDPRSRYDWWQGY